MTRERQLSRRGFLGGAAACLALPFLESLPGLGRVAQAQQSGSPKRFLYYFTPNGFYMPNVEPAQTGLAYDMPPTLLPLERHRDDMTVITNLVNTPAASYEAGDHSHGTASLLTAMPIRRTSDFTISVGVSVDQLAAESMSGSTRFKSLQLGLPDVRPSGECEPGYSCWYVSTVSWAGPQSPMPVTTDARYAFERLVAGLDPSLGTRARAERLRARRSVLDYVLEDARRLDGSLAAVDQVRLDEYPSGVRELEQRLETYDEVTACRLLDTPSDPVDLQESAELFDELMIMALRCDLTRVITFMTGQGVSSRGHAFLGAPEGHHGYSHHSGDSWQEHLALVERWQSERFAALLDRMKAVEEPGGTLFDNTLVCYSSLCGDGDEHDVRNIPAILTGRAGGAFAPGGHWRAEGAEFADLLLTAMNVLDVPLTTLGESGSQVLPELVSG